MESPSSSSDEDDCEAVFWNDWQPSSIRDNSELSSKVEVKEQDVLPSRTSTFDMDDKFGNWIPPASLLNPPKTTQTTLKKRKSLFCDTTDTREHKTEVTRSFSANIAFWRKEFMLSCEERVQLHDVTKFNDGDLIWGIVNLGVFGNIRLWVNEYGNICGLADGKISRPGSSETTFISIRNTEVLRKMLHLSRAQWASLCETVQETKTYLKYDAFEGSALKGKTSLEKLWLLICKRRHFIPSQCMLVKLCGAVKCLIKFKINHKLVVQDIRTLLGEAILD